MQLRKDSYFYKFLTHFDANVFVEHEKEYDNNGDWDWKRVEKTDTCTVVKVFALNFILSLIIALIVIGITIMCGDILGYIAASLFNWTFIEPGVPEIIAVMLGGIALFFGTIIGIQKWVQDRPSDSSLIPAIKAKADKICVPIDIVE